MTRGGSLLAASAMVLGTLVAPGTAALAQEQEPAPATPATEPVPGLIALTGLGTGSRTITLVTGDKVRLSDAGGGKYAVHPEPSVRPDGTSARLSTLATPKGVYVTPSDAMPAINAGRLDRELFNVTYLAENGYTDDKTKQLPVIVQYPPQHTDKAIASAAKAIPASEPVLTLESVNASALQVAKAEAGTFWNAVRAVPEKRADGIAGPANVPDTLRGDIAKVWLDGKVKADLAESVPMIGAPQAWAGGHDGTGVKVAVLDTGIDTKHPDLADRIADSRSFISGQEVQDGHGHGTHVASTIAGSGAAAAGKFKGVAPGAQLIVGKVLSDGGEGLDSGIIEGMEWAAASGAKVISMSLGGGATDGTDPMSQAVDTLSTSSGALFVIAAGNAGAAGAETVATPGAADAALTVAAVDKSDAWATFSSQGPRIGGGLKPDIAAPGVAIAAARAAGTTMGTPLDEHYTAANGTSMATPHVAGAAAIMAQQHPDWTGTQIKAALMSTAKDDALSVYKQGAGRVDVARAYTQKVFATTAGLDFGAVETDAAPATRELTYTNLGGRPVTLTLTPDLRASDGSAVEGGLSIAETTLTVPAGGTATATATVDPKTLADLDNYTGAVTAAADGVQLRTPVGVVREAPKATLTIHTLGRDGKPRSPWAQDTIDVSGDKGLLGGVALTAEGTTVVRVPQGVISVTQLMDWVGDDERSNLALLSVPELTVTGDTEITLDARKLTEVRFTTPQPAEPLSNIPYLAYQRTVSNGTPYMGFVWPGHAWTRVWALPTEKVTKGAFRFHTRFTLGKSEVAMSVRGRGGRGGLTLHPASALHGINTYGVHEQSDGFPDFRPFTGTRELQVVDVGEGRPEDIVGRDLRGKLVLMEAPMSAGLSGPVCGVQIERIGPIRDAGAAAIAHFPQPGTGCAIPMGFTQIPFTGEARPIGVPTASLPSREALDLRERLSGGKPVTIRVTGTEESPYTYTFAPYEEGRVPRSLHYTFAERDLARIDLAPHTVAPARYNDWRYAQKPDDVMPMSTSLTGWGAPRLTLQERRDWVGPLDSEVLWSHGMEEMRGTPMEDRVPQWALEVFDKPVRIRQSWMTTPFTPGAATGSDKVYKLAKPGANIGSFFRCMICVQGDSLWAEFEPSYGSPGARKYNGDYWPTTDLSKPGFDVRLYQDGKEIPRTPVGGTDFMPLFSLPDGPGSYRLTAKNDRNDTEWTFTTPVSADPLPGSFCSLEVLYGKAEPCKPAPVVFVGYDLGDTLDAANAVRAGRTHTFTVSPYHSPSPSKMPAIAGLKLWASTDDGATYTPVSVKSSKDGTYTATTRYPALKHTKGAVTLKVEAWDKAGNTIKQTTVRAFDLRG
ncbi:S8 family serine peptidase [Streptosporangium sp. NPDC002607]